MMKTILIADDNEINRMIAREMLLTLGYEADEAGDGRAAVELFQRAPERYAMAMIDVEMPIMDGIETIRAIRGTAPIGARIPIMAVTAHSGDSEEAMALAAGANACLNKPFDQERLKSIVARWIDTPAAAPATTEADPLASLYGVDVADGLHRIMNNRTLFVKFLKQFRDRFRNAAPELDDLIRGERWADARLLAHSMKGSGGTLGIKIIYQHAAAVETVLKQAVELNRKPEELDAAMDVFRGELQKVMHSLDILT